MEIKVGEYEILESGTIIGNDNEPIDFIIDSTTNYIIRFTFKNDAENKQWTATASRFGANGLEITFVNFNNSLGIGNLAPIPVGQMNRRQLFLNYRIYALDKAGKLVHYSFLLGKGVQNG
jgi:hypothetical protein